MITIYLVFPYSPSKSPSRFSSTLHVLYFILLCALFRLFKPSTVCCWLIMLRKVRGGGQLRKIVKGGGQQVRFLGNSEGGA